MSVTGLKSPGTHLYVQKQKSSRYAVVGLRRYTLEGRFISGHYPDNKVHGANMGPIWGRQDPGGPDVGPMNFATWVM